MEIRRQGSRGRDAAVSWLGMEKLQRLKGDTWRVNFLAMIFGHGIPKHESMRDLVVSYTSSYHYGLVGSLEHFLFSHLLGIIIPTD